MKFGVLAVVLGALACGGPIQNGEALIQIPTGATFREVVDTLDAGGVVARPFLFEVYARMKGQDRSIRAGTYRLTRGAPYGEILTSLTEGRVETYPVTIPEGLTIKAMAGRLAQAAQTDSAVVVDALAADSAHLDWGVPGPGLEGYLLPDTYRFAKGVTLDQVVRAMVEEYRAFWTPGRRERLKELGLSERELVTLASIIQAEARRVDEMPTISSVYHNRLRIGMLLQADPTVLYALGGPRPRLLYAAIDSVADHPYNTYSQPGLPPGPICAPGVDALQAALFPAETDFLYFVAQRDGSHFFSRSLREHNNARIRIRQGTREPA